MGAVHPGGTFRGAAKLRLYLKSLRMEKYFEGRNFRKGLQKSQILGYETKSSRGGRHPSYATALKRM